jgi:16S rRNA (guanine527-N7)-methyltransferase
MIRSTVESTLDLAANRDEALRLTPVSRETLRRLDNFVALLLQWQQKVNLIAASTVPHLWTRHIADSLQLLDLLPDAKVWVDLGSGGGFPGLILACALAETPGAHVHLIESNGKKATFLREAITVTEAPAEVHAARLENMVDSLRGRADAVSARAFSPLKTLLDQSAPLLQAGAIGVFPKGQDVEAELTEASKYWTMRSALTPSRTNPAARIVVIRALAAARPPTTRRTPSQ